MDGSSSNQLSELGVPQLLNLADFLIEGDKFVGLLLSLVGLISLRKFWGLLLKLSSEDPTHLLREDSAHDTFWKILQQEGASCQSGMEALPKLQPFFIDRMQKLSPCRQAGMARRAEMTLPTSPNALLPIKEDNCHDCP